MEEQKKRGRPKKDKEPIAEVVEEPVVEELEVEELEEVKNELPSNEKKVIINDKEYIEVNTGLETYLK